MQPLSAGSPQNWLIWFFKGLLVVALVVLVGRLAELQIIKGAYFRDLAEGNRIRNVPITAPRGNILARGGELLVGNEEVAKTVIFDPKEGFEKIFANANTPEDEIINEWQRKYFFGADTAHVSGYLGEANENEVNKVDAHCQDKGVRKYGSFIGRGGLEEQYDCMLRGLDGEEMVEVDTFGKKIRTLGRKPSLPGDDLMTTIDIGLQKKSAEAMRGKIGAVVITDGRGEVLSLYSSPSYDPNVFISGSKEASEKIGDLLTDPELPLFNRAIGGAYHPGSVYKLVTATAALEEGAIERDYEYNDTGAIEVNGFTFRNWYQTQYGGTEGNINVVRALARSTDTFFYKIGELMGIDALVAWSEKFGLGKKTEIDLPGEIAGLLPSPSWKKAVKGERWFLGNTYHMSIGQGDLTVTALESNLITSVIASGGKYCRPHILADELAGHECTDVGIEKATIDTVRDGMIGACSAGGTAFPFFDFPEPVACKTGTAETSEEDSTHAWFTVFAPVDNPEIVITVLIEKGGEGSRDAAPVARAIMDWWYLQKNP